MKSSSKFILKSKTFWGAIIAALPAALPAFGVDPGVAGQITTAAGAVLAVYGRATATGPLHVTSPTPQS